MWSVWLWLFPQGASVGGTCAGTQPQANWLSQRKRKTEKKQLSQTQLPSSKIRQTTTRWVRVILGRGLQQPLLQQPALWNCAQVSRSLTFSEISNLETWSPTVLESLTHYSELLKTWRGSSSCRQLCNRTLAGPSLTRLVATSLSFLSRRDFLIWPGESGHLPPLQVGRQDNQRGRADRGLLQRCWLLQLWVWTTSGKLMMMILVDVKAFDDDSCKLDFENPGIATSCCCFISATESKDQLKQTSTLCRGLNIFWKIHTYWKIW